MVRTAGIVSEINNGIARVSVMCGIKCEGCACGISRSTAGAGFKPAPTIVAKTGSLHPEPGNTVVVAAKEASVLRDGLLVFVLPLALGFAGFEIGAGFFSQAAGIILGIALFILPYAYLLIKRRKPELIIERIIDNPGNNAADSA